MAARSAASAFDNFFLALINEPNGMEESSIDHQTYISYFFSLRRCNLDSYVYQD
jgi:hypothetical protein